jgi:hypothetical protein
MHSDLEVPEFFLRETRKDFVQSLKLENPQFIDDPDNPDNEIINKNVYQLSKS